MTNALCKPSGVLTSVEKKTSVANLCTVALYCFEVSYSRYVEVSYLSLFLRLVVVRA
jgi:hypothetical protein